MCPQVVSSCRDPTGVGSSSLEMIAEVVVGDRGDADDGLCVLELTHHVSPLVRVQVAGEDVLITSHLISIIPCHQPPAPP